MSQELSVHLLPTLFEPDELRGGIAVMIDVLRASTTIIHAMAAGATAVIPCETLEDARQFASGSQALPGNPATFPGRAWERGGGDVVLGGERNGTRIEGFDLDNSPLNYTEETVRGKTVVFTTTNGTRALLRCRQADRILIGAFVNQSAVCETLRADKRPIHLVCAGTDGQVSAEDVLCAGAIASTVIGDDVGRNSIPSGRIENPSYKNDSAQLAVDFYAANSADEKTIAQTVRAGLGGRNLQQLGFEADIRRAACTDLFDLVPEFSPQTGRIHLPAATKRTSGARPRR